MTQIQQSMRIDKFGKHSLKLNDNLFGINAGTYSNFTINNQ